MSQTASTGAFRQIGPTKIAVFTVTNGGVLVNRQGQVVRGNLDPATGQRSRLSDVLAERFVIQDMPAQREGQTTLTLVITNQKLPPFQLRQVARQVHTSMARAIDPFHTSGDGDVLYAVTTDDIANETLDPRSLGVLASELAWDAVLRSFEE